MPSVIVSNPVRFSCFGPAYRCRCAKGQIANSKHATCAIVSGVSGNNEITVSTLNGLVIWWDQSLYGKSNLYLPWLQVLQKTVQANGCRETIRCTRTYLGLIMEVPQAKRRTAPVPGRITSAIPPPDNPPSPIGAMTVDSLV